MSEARAKNALVGETSPYLLQHAGNPVDWYPWGGAALEKACREDKPILLSIGYLACHWCHVMAHESFEDERTAELMNRYFINIKVDREERPDLDKIYQLAHRFLTRRPGGWPLTMFLAPDDQVPFFGGTYFPDQPRHGMPAFSEILTNVAEAYRERREDIRQQNASVREALEGLETNTASREPITEAPLELFLTQSSQDFDRQNGGFGDAPKFPHPTTLDHLLRRYTVPLPKMTTGGEGALVMTSFTLAQMANGGIYDQIGGGFYRYSVDSGWEIPHFEKMLYDNALLLRLYADTWQVTGNPLFQRIALETGDWVMGEMQSPEGGYYSALDADSAGEDGGLQEGRFYLWSPKEVQALLTEEEYRVVRLRFGLDRPANFEGKWHLRVTTNAEQLTGECELSEENLGQLLASARRKLFLTRRKRTRPHRDEKILTAWNALMIKAMAGAGRVLKEASFTRSAEKALAFVRKELWRDGRLLATCKDGRAHLPAYLDDYVFLMDALLELLQSRWRSGDLDLTRALAEVVLAQFQDHQRDDPGRGGFYFTANDHENLIYRPKPMRDEALPAGNGIAVRVLARLGHLLGETRYLEAAENTLRAVWPDLNKFPQAYTTLLSGVEEHLRAPRIIVLRGGGKSLEQWRERCQRHYAPGRLVFAIPAEIDTLPAALGTLVPRGGTVAYLCEGYRCQEPVTDLEALDKALES
ncbi:MAG: hypothetical protein BECKG1743D_GA0114223_100154 [Candidatus Kentron sp. G]|nr:MAG: hypothetical protein BECKG1743F_GA0114225_100372 [Candidatus Kentron sp. G]VFM95965.1 MAG: hypothetical protein BECKG1743E_GA0114224_100282 [Candidatus Kentron sp. G]VFM96007.1 MAG: hypothetical protein BECKG1743F_GA0114225_101162 [Candidatus Kentron sp. G]VFM97484.1 MAG: hypothetical protein BECKG1743D_GA0114223_100154 [Candidatus Kentron sp. G]